MNIKEIAAKLIDMREHKMSSFIMSGQLREELGFEGYGEALRQRWIMADEDGSGMIQITNNLGAVAEMKRLAEEFAKEEVCSVCKKEGCKCKCKGGKCVCKCTTDESVRSLRECAEIAVHHANRTKMTLAEIATMGLGRQPDSAGTPVVGLGAQSAQPSATPAATTTAAADTSSAPSARPSALSLNSPVSIVQDGKSYVGKVSQLAGNKIRISFTGEQPKNVRDYDASEVTPVANEPAR
jgi:hypothetical protein